VIDGGHSLFISMFYVAPYHRIGFMNGFDAFAIIEWQLDRLADDFAAMLNRKKKT